MAQESKCPQRYEPDIWEGQLCFWSAVEADHRAIYPKGNADYVDTETDIPPLSHDCNY